MNYSDLYKEAKEVTSDFDGFVDKITEFYIDSVLGRRTIEKIFNLYTFLIGAVRFYLNQSVANKNTKYNKEEVDKNMNYAISHIKNGKYKKIIENKKLL